MAVLPSDPAWTTAKYPPALPYMVQHRCFTYCETGPGCALTYIPAPCICIDQPPSGETETEAARRGAAATSHAT